MTPERWERVSSIWHAVLERPVDERAAAVDQLCEGDESLQREVESLLAHLARADAAGFGTPARSGSHAPIAPGTSLGPYQVRDQIGAGGMGVVYRARDPRLGRDVAIKVLPMDVARDPERLRRFEQEARSAAAPNHPNIVAVYDIGRYDGAPYIVSELLDGSTLRERLNESRATGLPVRKAIDYAVQIARGLSAAHEKGIVHRDLKPENVFITSDGHAKILDFGLAKLTEADERVSEVRTAPAESHQTQQGVVLGTVGYMAPEQVRGQATDARADLFAFGATFYEMLAGRRAFRGETAVDTLSAILSQEPPSLSSTDGRVPPSLALVVHRCLEKAPGARFQTATDLAFALEALSGSNPALVAPGRETASRRRTLQWMAGLAVTAATVVAASKPWTMPEVAPPTPPPTPPPPPPTPTPPPLPDPMYVYVPRPAGTQYTNRGRQVITITPDGNRIVFVANGTLWVRRLDTAEEATPIDDIPSNGLHTPFPSPDGQRVGFTQGGTLWTISLDGGAPQKVCTPGPGSGASWGNDDRIVFALQDGVYEVPAEGGTPRHIIEISPPEHAYGPQMLPDREHVLMTITTSTSGGRWNDGKIVVQSVKTGKRRVLIQRGRDARFLDTGHLVYVDGTRLYAVAFDTSALQVRNPPVAMEEGVRGTAAITGAAFFAVSQTGHLVYVPAVEDSPANSMALVDIYGNSTMLPFTLVDSKPRFSPDGKRFIAAPRNDNEEGALWIYSTDGSEDPRQVPGSNRSGTRRVRHGAIWERDWAITFSTGDQFVRVPDGGNGAPELLPTTGGSAIGWSLDGTTFFHGGQQLWTWRKGEGSKKLLPEGERIKGGGASLSPDGKWIAYWTNEENDGGIGSYILSIENPRFRQRIGDGHHPVWHPDGKHIFFMKSETTTLVMVDVQTSPSFSVGSPKPILSWVAQETNHGRNYDVHPDGKVIVELIEDRFQPSASLINLVFNWKTKLLRKIPTGSQ